MATLHISGIDSSTGQKKQLESGDTASDVSGGTLLSSTAHGTTDHAGLPGILLLLATPTVTSAEVLALHTTPITLVAAPAAGYHLRIVSISAKLLYATTDYDAGGGSMLDITYGDETGPAPTMGFSDSFVTAPIAELAIRVGIDTDMVPEASALVISAPSAYILGDSDIDFRILYQVVSFT